MTEREKELEELRYILLISSKMCAQMEADECEFVAQKIQEAGYTKKHFPVEELEAWLREKVIRYSNNGFCGCPFCNRLIEVSDKGEKRVCEHLCDWNKITDNKWFFKFSLFDSLCILNKLNELKEE